MLLPVTVTKSVILKGHWKDKIVYYPIEDEFQTKFSYLAIGSVSYRCQSRINTAVALTCNYVTGHRYNVTEKRVENYELPLTVFQIKTTAAENISVTRITPVWFNINTRSEKLEFSLTNTETDLALPIEVKHHCLNFANAKIIMRIAVIGLAPAQDVVKKYAFFFPFAPFNKLNVRKRKARKNP